MQATPYIMSLVRKHQQGKDLFPEELEVLDEAGYFDTDDMDDPPYPYDSPSLEDRGLYLGSYGS